MALIRNSPSRWLRFIFQSNTNPSKHLCLSLHILHHPGHSGCSSHRPTRHCGLNKSEISYKSDKIWTFFVFICDPPSQIAHQTVKFHIQRPILVTQQKILYRIKLKISESKTVSCNQFGLISSSSSYICYMSWGQNKRRAKL